MTEQDFVEHECQYTDDEERPIVFSKNATNGFKNAWNLTIRRIAEEEDLEENHYLESEGDIIWEATIEIRFCPFCGTQLEGAREFEGEILLYDAASGWHGKYM